VVRYQEGRKEQPLIYDPFAHLFVSPQGEEMLRAALEGWPFFSEYLIVRAKFIDDYLESFCEKGNITQTVILGSGNDMRAARLPFLKKGKVFEVDFPDRINWKKDFLKSSLGKLEDNVVYLGTDLRSSDLVALLSQAGFVPEQRAVLIMEGLLYYMGTEGVDHLFEEFLHLPPLGNVFLLDQISQDVSQNSPSPEKRTKTPYPPDPLSYLTQRGFTIIESALLGDLTMRHFGHHHPERWWSIASER
jgi:methyltransferase (TIGR00027 family)